MRISSEQFVTTYIRRGGVADTASELGVSRAAVAQRVKKMRQAGVKLPLKRERRGYDVQALNNLIKELKNDQ